MAIGVEWALGCGVFAGEKKERTHDTVNLLHPRLVILFGQRELAVPEVLALIKI